MDRNKVFRVAKTEYVKWIRNPKMIILLVMLIFAYDYVILELTTAADKMGEQLQIFEGFIGISNSQLLLMIIPIVFVGLMGDFPRVDGNAMFYIYRIGKSNWILGQMVFAMMAAGTYLLALIGFSCLTLWGRCYAENRWSEITTKYYLFAPNDYMSTVANLTTGRLYNNLPPWNAVLHICGLMFLFLLLISMMLLTGFVCKMRVGAIILTVGLLCLGNVLAYMENNIRWFFPTVHAILEIHFDEIYKKPIMDLCVSYIYYLVCIIAGVLISYMTIERYDFSRIQEMEE